MGRGHESDLRVTDISVSRCHAILKYDAQDSHGFYLEDNLSKFGTLVLSNSDLVEIDESQTKALQIGRSVISFCLKRLEEPPKKSLVVKTKKLSHLLPVSREQTCLKTPSPKRIDCSATKQSGGGANSFAKMEEKLKQKIEETN